MINHCTNQDLPSLKLSCPELKVPAKKQTVKIYKEYSGNDGYTCYEAARGYAKFRNMAGDEVAIQYPTETAHVIQKGDIAVIK